MNVDEKTVRTIVVNLDAKVDTSSAEQTIKKLADAMQCIGEVETKEPAPETMDAAKKRVNDELDQSSAKIKALIAEIQNGQKPNRLTINIAELEAMPTGDMIKTALKKQLLLLLKGVVSEDPYDSLEFSSSVLSTARLLWDLTNDVNVY